MSVAAIRQGLATNLGVIPETTVYPRIQMPTPPTIWVSTIHTEYDKSYGSRVTGKQYTDTYTATVQAMVNFNDQQGSGELLDQYLASSGALSVKAAIEADKTLAGAADTLWVQESNGPALDTFQTLSLLLAEWTVIIIATEVAL